MLRGLDAGAMRAQPRRHPDEIDARGLPVLLAGLPAPPNYPADYRARVQGRLPRRSPREHGAIYVAPSSAAWAEGRSMREIMAPDAARRPAPERRGRRGHRRGHRARSGARAACARGAATPVIRAFAALALPEPVRFDLMLLQQGLPVPRPVPPENLHLTLVFLGELPERRLEDVDLAFRAVARAGLRAGARRRRPLRRRPKPRVVYVGVAANPALAPPPGQGRDRGARRRRRAAGRRFVPHVTLARLPERLRRPRAAGAGGRGAAAATRRRASRSRTSASTARSSAAAAPVYEELARYPLG